MTFAFFIFTQQVEEDSVTTMSEKEELLLKKKVILERVLAKLKELILINSDKDPASAGNQGLLRCLWVPSTPSMVYNAHLYKGQYPYFNKVEGHGKVYLEN